MNAIPSAVTTLHGLLKDIGQSWNQRRVLVGATKTCIFEFHMKSIQLKNYGAFNFTIDVCSCKENKIIVFVTATKGFAQSHLELSNSSHRDAVIHWHGGFRPKAGKKKLLPRYYIIRKFWLMPPKHGMTVHLLHL
jgi:hypothetical protein